MEWSCILSPLCGRHPDIRILRPWCSPCSPAAHFNFVVHTLEWMQANRLQLNATKTEQLWCAPPWQQEYLPHIPLLIGSHAVQPVWCVRNLGIYIDSDLSMRSHVSKAVSNSFAALRRFRSIRRLVSQPVLLSLVTPWRDLIVAVTLAGLPGHLLDRLQSILNAAARAEVRPRRDLHCKECSFDWPYSFSAAVTTWRLHTSSAIFNGLTKRSRCDDYGLTLNSGWSYLERNSEPWVTALSVWWLLVHGTVFQPVSLQLLPWLPSKDN